LGAVLAHLGHRGTDFIENGEKATNHRNLIVFKSFWVVWGVHLEPFGGHVGLAMLAHLGDKMGYAGPSWRYAAASWRRDATYERQDEPRWRPRAPRGANLSPKSSQHKPV